MNFLFQGDKPKTQRKRKERRRKFNQQTEEKGKGAESESISIVLKTMIKFIDPSDQQIDLNLQEFIQSQYTRYQELPIVEGFEREDDYGNIQYKLKLINPTHQRLVHLTTQMKFRLSEGMGQAHYRLGVQDNGTPYGLSKQEMFQSLKTICHLAQNLKVQIVIQRVARGLKGLIIQLIVRKNINIGLGIQIKLLLLGDTGSGKSTLLGVLTTGQKDNGNGKARMQVCTHKHDLLRGSTSSINQYVIGFDADGKLVNKSFFVTSLQNIVLSSSKLVTFIDTGGSKVSHLLTSLHSYFPQYVVWMVSPLNPNIGDQHLQLSIICKVPIIVVITHIDAVPEQSVKRTIASIKDKLHAICPNKVPLCVRNNQDTVLFSRTISDQQTVPIFLTSCVTAQGLDLLTNFLSILPCHLNSKQDYPHNSQFLVVETYDIKGKIVFGGTVLKGVIRKGKIMHLGPDSKGSFWPVQIQSIECKRVRVSMATSGQTCSIGIQLLPHAKDWYQIQGNSIRKGMVLVQSKSNPRAIFQFLIQLNLYGKCEDVLINDTYKPVINTKCSRQSCKVIINLKEDQPKLQLKKRQSKSIQIQRNRKPSQDMKNLKLRFQKKTQKKSVDLSAIDLKMLFNEEVIEQCEIQKQKKKKRKQKNLKLQFGKTNYLRLRFEYACQYLQIGDRVIIHDNCLQAFGSVKDIFY